MSSHSEPVTPSVAPGFVINGRFVLVSILGEGGFGTVWLAKDTSLGDKFRAIKILTDNAGKKLIERFKREVLIAQEITHEGVVRVYDWIDFVDPGGKRRCAISMEYVEGGVTLHQMLLEGLPSRHEALHIAATLLRTLMFVHDKGIIHRDLKPENVLVLQQDGVLTFKIADFGLARSATPSETRFTKVGAAMGSYGYGSPEQLLGFDVTKASDIFPMGVILAVLLGVPPMQSDDRGGVPYLSTSRHNAWLESVSHLPSRAIIEKATRSWLVDGNIVHDRYPDARAMLLAVEAVLRDTPKTEPAWTPYADVADAVPIIGSTAMPSGTAEASMGGPRSHASLTQVPDVDEGSPASTVKTGGLRWGRVLGIIAMLGAVILGLVMVIVRPFASDDPKPVVPIVEISDPTPTVITAATETEDDIDPGVPAVVEPIAPTESHTTPPAPIVATPVVAPPPKEAPQTPTETSVSTTATQVGRDLEVIATVTSPSGTVNGKVILYVTIDGTSTKRAMRGDGGRFTATVTLPEGAHEVAYHVTNVEGDGTKHASAEARVILVP